MQNPIPIRVLEKRLSRFGQAMGLAVLAMAAGSAALAQDAVRVSWTPNTETDLEGYRVYSGTSSKALSIAATVSGATSARLTGLAPSTTYYFAVQAFNSSGLASDLSAEVSFTTRALVVPDISIRTAEGQELASGSASLGLPAASVGVSSAPRQLVISNIGTSSLSNLGFTVGGEHPGDFEISTTGQPELAPGASTNVQVTFLPQAAGQRSATLTVTSNDPDEAAFAIQLTGTATEGGGILLPEISVRNSAGLGLSTGGSLPAGPVDLLATGAPQGISIHNIGSAPLENLTLSVEGANPADFQVHGGPPNQLAPGGSSAFSVSFRPTAEGARSALLRIASSDADEPVFDLILSGTGVAHPEIAVSHASGGELAGGSATLGFGSVNLGAPGAYQAITLRNTGTGDLTGLSVALEGSDQGDFALTLPATSVLPPGASSTLGITFLPQSNGARSAILRITSNDADESPFDILLTGTGVAAPEISIEKSDGSSLSDGSAAISFGVLSLGADSATQNFIIRNLGTANLSGLTITPGGPHASDFTVTGPAAAPVAPEDFATFSVIFRPGAAGTRTASLQIASNDADESPFDISLSGTGVATPEVSVEKPDSTLIADGGAISFGALYPSAPAITQSLTLRNLGTAQLTGIGISVDGAHASDFSITLLPPSTLAPGAASAIGIAFKPGGIGLRSAFVRIASNDPDENPYDIQLSGTGLASPEIAVEKSDGTSLVDGTSTLDLGSIQLGPGTASQTLTIRNSGPGNLTDLAATLSGANPGDFTLSALTTTTLVPGATTSLSVVFKPGAAGARTAILRIASNDADENPFDIVLGGTGVAVPEIAIEKSDGSPLTDGVGSVAFGTLNLSAPAVIQSFTLRNSGTATLGGISLSIDGTHAADFMVTTAPGSSVAAGATTVFSISFRPTGTGTRTAFVRVASNDADENPFDIPLTGSGFTAPEIAVEKSGAVAVADGGSHAFPALIIGTAPASQTFTIRNTGNAPLTGLALGFSGSHPLDFSASALSATSLPPGGSLNFTLSFQAKGSGGRSAVVRIASNDADENPYDISLTGSGIAVPEIAVEDADGAPLPDSTGSIQFGNTSLGSSSPSRLVTIFNTGSAPLTLSSHALDGPHATDFLISLSTPVTLPPGGQAALGIRFRPGAAGSRSAWLRIVNSDADESTYDIPLIGVGVEVPEISIDAEGSPNLESNVSVVGFQTVELHAAGTRKSFLIRNTGTAALKLLKASIDGLHASDFSLTQPAQSTLAPGTASGFEVSFRPGQSGPRSALLRIASNDADEAEFLVPLSGNGVALPKIEILLVTSPASALRTAQAHSFGSLELRRASPELTYVVRNRGSADLANLSVQLTGAHIADFTLRKLAVTRLSPGATATFSTAFQPANVGNRAAVIRVTSNDPDQGTIDIPLTGFGFIKPEIEVLAKNQTLAHGAGLLDFGSLDVGSPRLVETVTIINTGTAALENLSLALEPSPSNAFLTGRLDRSTLLPGDRMNVTVMFQPSRAGTFASQLRIASNDADEPVFALPLKGTGVTSPSLDIRRNAGSGWIVGRDKIAFADTYPGSNSASQTLILQNTGTAPLSISAMKISGDHAGDFSASGMAAAEVAPGSSRTLNLTFRPLKAGDRHAVLQIGSNDPDLPGIVIPLSGKGIATPKMEVSLGKKKILDSEFLDFAPKASRVITIRNRGTAPLSNLSAKIADGANSGFSLVPLRVKSIAPGKSATLKITFKPKPSSTSFAYLRITSNDPSGVDFDVILNGTSSPAPRRKSAPVVKPSPVPSAPAAEKIELSTVVIDGLRYRCITVPRTARPEVTADTVQVSSDRVRWSSGKNFTTVLTDRPDLLRVRDNTPLSAGGKRFIRLKKR